MRMVRQRHPDIAEFMMTNLADGAGPCFVSVRGCQQSLVEAGLEMPSWAELSESPLVLEENSEPNQPKVGWQRKAVRQVEVHPRSWPTSTTRFVEIPTWAACFRPFDSPPDLQNDKDRGAAVPDPALSSSPVSPSPFLRSCRCGRQLDSFGHHRAACHVAGVLGRRGMLWNALLCREAGARVTTNMFVRDMDLGHFNALDARRLEVVADGLTLWRGAQLAIDTTLVSPLRRDGSARNRALALHWMRLASARRGPTLNSVAKEVGPAWLCWPPRLGSMERGDCSVHHRVGERAG